MAAPDNGWYGEEKREPTDVYAGQRMGEGKRGEEKKPANSRGRPANVGGEEGRTNG